MSRAGLAAAANLLDPPPPDDPWPILGYNPSPKQRKFHEATEWDVLYGGAMGGGKTVALLMEGIRACVYHPGIEVWVFRRTTVQLRGSIIKELARFGYAKKIGCRWKDQERQLHFPKHGGSVLKFVYADNEKDATDYYSWECNMLIIDERQLMPPSIVEHLSLRIRSGHNDPVLGIRSGANPGGIGHGYLRSGWVRPATTDTKGNPLNIIDPLNEPGEDTDVRITPVHPNGKLGRPRRFILAKWYDNPHLNDDYEQNFEDIPDPVLREAMRDGNWDLFADMAFPEWRPEVYVVDPEEYPISLGGVVRAVGIDWGITAPFCALWGAKTGQDDTIIVYRELYKAGLTTEEQAQEILSVESDEERVSGRRATYYVDPSMGKAGSWTTGEKAAWYAPKSDAWIYAHNGIPVARAVNDRVLGKRQIHEQLRCVGPSEDRRPKLLIYSNCTNLIRTLPELMRSQRNPEDVEDKGAEDHCIAKGTLIETPSGLRRIETVRPGDRVQIRDGEGLVVAAGRVGVAQPVVTVSLANGDNLTLTADHKVLTQRGWIRAASLTHYDMAWTRSSSPEPSKSTTAAAGISAGSISGATVGSCTVRSGSTITDRSRQTSTFTTSTVTELTTVSPISRYWPRKSTLAFTVACHPRLLAKHVAATLGLLRAPATPSSPRNNGVTPHGAGGRNPNWLRSPAPSAERKSSRRFRRGRSSADSTAGLALVAVLEVNDAGTSDVYDLTVLGRSEFVANGILVSNCYDALRYLVCGLMLRTPTVTKRGPGAPRTTTAAASRAAF